MAELIKLRPLFPGKNAKTQIQEIFKVIGTPAAREVVAMNPEYRNKTFPALSSMPFETNFPAMVDPNALDFL